MRVSIDWLREFTPYEGDVQTLADRLTMLGLEVDAIERPFAELEGLVVGHVVERTAHPDADKLSLTRVDVGGEVLDIVCGAPNVAAGQMVAVAKVGTTLPGGLTLKKAKIRGAASHGMICSERELGLSEDHSGIMVLEEALAPGARLVEALGLDTLVLDIDLTPNRADCLSHLGVAREVALSFDLPLALPDFSVHETGRERADDLWAVEIADPADCPLYQLRLIRGITIGPSPAWLRYRLLALGQRPISNVVDVTNYIMMELGQPLHSFDEDTMRGGLVRVARATPGMRFRTLDGQDRQLNDRDLLIWDAERPVGLAGVMGGEETEITDASRNVLLECAVFDPPTIRRTARRLALPSEASHRFERGVDQVLSHKAVDRAAELIRVLAGGEVLPGVAASEPRPWTQPTLTFRPERARQVLGLDVEDAFSAKTLDGLGCEVTTTGFASWTVRPPSHRSDLEREIDLVEEIGRVWGIDHIPTKLPQVRRAMDAAGGITEFAFLSLVKHWARGAGLAECINYSFVGHTDLDQLAQPTEARIPVANPLSEDQNVMRTSLAPGLLANLRLNIARATADMRLFEVAKAFFADADSETGAREVVRLGMLLHGARFAAGHPWPDEDADYSDLKGLVEDLWARLGLGEPELAVTRHPWLQPCVSVSLAGQELGVLGRVTNAVAATCKARKPVWLAELDLAPLMAAYAASRICFSELPKFPPIRRDVTLVAQPGVQVGAVLEAARNAGEKLLESTQLIDEYRPDTDCPRNLTFRMTYRHPGKTLTDKDADKAHGKLVAKLADTLPVKPQE